MNTPMIDKAIQCLVEREVERALDAYYQKLLRKVDEDGYNNRRFAGSDFLRLYCSPKDIR